MFANSPPPPTQNHNNHDYEFGESNIDISIYKETQV